jgi:hypothetical protein
VSPSVQRTPDRTIFDVTFGAANTTKTEFRLLRFHLWCSPKAISWLVVGGRWFLFAYTAFA